MEAEGTQLKRFFLVEQSAIGAGGHYFSYSTAVAEAAANAGFEVVILANRRLASAFPLEAARVIPAFSRTWGESYLLGTTEWREGSLAFEFARAVRGDPPRPGDQVLLHTLSPVELESILNYLARIPPTRDMATFHILLRYDPEELKPAARAIRPALDRIRNSPLLGRRVVFHADTEPLADAFTKLLNIPFKTAPIPFPQAALVRALAKPRAASPRHPLTALYLGDARAEKGYHLLPGMVEALWDDLIRPGKLRLVLQSNFNVKGGEEGIADAYDRLAGCGFRVEILTDALSIEDYYDLITQADIILLPYSTSRYRLRSSGVLVEALAAGKVVVTPRGSWLADYAERGGAVIYDEADGLAPALRRAVEAFSSLTALAQARQPENLARARGETFVGHLLEDEPARGATVATAAPGPRILLVMDGEAMVLRNGASRVAEAQVAYLCRAGYRVCGLFLARDPHEGFDAQEAWVERLRDRVFDWPLDGFFLALAGRATTHQAAARSHASRSHADSSVTGDLDAAAAMDFGGELLLDLHRDPVSATLLNYVTNFPVIEAIGLAGTPVVCEMHDIQSHQRALYANRALSEADLLAEMAALARCAGLISLNVDETTFVQGRLPGARIVTTGVQIPYRSLTIEVLAGARNLVQVVQAARPGPGALAGPIDGAPDDATGFERLAKLETLDLLFVSSSHLSNVPGLVWFIDEVYRPYLAPLGISLVVAGAISDLATTPPDLDRVVFVGPVADLDPLYAAATVCILPVTAGAGAPVKTIEALAYGKPVVATSMALRGAPALAGLPAYDEPEAFAQAAAALLSDPHLRQQAARAGFDAFSRACDPATFAAAMDAAFGFALGKAALRTSTPAPAAPPMAAPTAWSPELGAVNRLLRALIVHERIDDRALAILSTVGVDRALGLLEAMFQALVTGRGAPVLAVDSRLRDRLSERGSSSHRRWRSVLRAAIAEACGAAGEADTMVLPSSAATMRLTRMGTGARFEAPA